MKTLAPRQENAIRHLKTFFKAGSSPYRAFNFAMFRCCISSIARSHPWARVSFESG
mgnify:CR=1 FL=1